ncbi:cupin domain-containing protein [Pantoea cypripedii]|nr:cupin domain-containing protein [Pantoea cypripedii]MBP2195119.1 quercetin dioxygenase-like cupin family protein [Pantoea cypripedii]
MSNITLKKPTPKILTPNEGEQLTRRWGYPLTIKIDPVTTGTPTFSIGTEDISPGKQIPPHWHPTSEEVVIVLSGTLYGFLDGKYAELGPGSMVYAPINTVMGFENRTNEIATIVWIFSKPGFEQYVRATSVPAGQEVVPMTKEELDAVRVKYKDYIELDGGDLLQYPENIASTD